MVWFLFQWFLITLYKEGKSSGKLHMTYFRKLMNVYCFVNSRQKISWNFLSPNWNLHSLLINFLSFHIRSKAFLHICYSYNLPVSDSTMQCMQGVLAVCLISIVTKIWDSPFNYHGSQIPHFHFTHYSNFYTLTFFIIVSRNTASLLKYFLSAELLKHLPGHTVWQFTFYNEHLRTFSTRSVVFFVVHWIQCWPLYPTLPGKEGKGFLQWTILLQNVLRVRPGSRFYSSIALWVY
jgi:hypothetical protein